MQPPPDEQSREKTWHRIHGKQGLLPVGPGSFLGPLTFNLPCAYKKVKHAVR